MNKFKNPLAYRALNFAIKLERISQGNAKRSMEELIRLADIQNKVNATFDDLYTFIKLEEDAIKEISNTKGRNK